MVRGPLPLCYQHCRKLFNTVPTGKRVGTESAAPMLAEAFRLVPCDIEAQILAEWSPQMLARAWHPRSGERRAKIPSAVRQAIYARDGYCCCWCRATEKLTLDHIIPWSLGGSDAAENLRTMCLDCNVRRGAGREVGP